MAKLDIIFYLERFALFINQILEKMQANIVDEMVSSFEEYEFLGQDIVNILQKNIKVVLYKDLESLEIMFREATRICIIISRKIQSQILNHYVCMNYNEKRRKLSYFDPYGFTLEEDLQLANDRRNPCNWRLQLFQSDCGNSGQ